MLTETRVPHHVTVLTGAYAFIGGLASFLGWALGIYWLTDWTGSGIWIKANTALACTAAGAAVLTVALYSKARWLVRLLAGFVATVGGLTLIEHLTGISLGIYTAAK